MADNSGGLSRTLLGGHEELFDYICNQCEDGDKITEACVYCQDCGRGYCQPCLTLHSQFPLMKQHILLGKSRIQEWGKAARATGTGLTCPEHAEEYISMYCGNHDLVCCAVCVSLEHRNCKKMNYIPKICKDIRQSRELLATESDVSKSLSGVKAVYDEKKKCKTVIDDSRGNIVKAIKDFRQDVLDTFDDLEKRAMKDTDKVYNTLDDELKGELKICDDLKSELDEMQQQLNTSVGKESQLFVQMKKCQKEVSRHNIMIQHLSSKPNLYRFDISFNPDLVQLVKRVKTLGDITTEFPISRQYVVRKQYTRRIRNKDEHDNCFISDICQLQDGRIVCSDYHNKKVVLLDNAQYNVVDSCRMPEKPRGITCSIYPEVAVALKNRTIQFITITDDKIVPTRSFAVGSNCYGLAYHTGRFYVSNMKEKVFVYDAAGSLLCTIQKDKSGSDIFSSPRNIVISKDGAKVHVADVNKGLVTVDREGNHLSTTTDQCLQGAFGVCLDNYGNILVSGYESCNVVQIEKGGNKVIGELIGGSDTLAAPISTCFDTYLNNLLVSSNPQDGCGSLMVFEIE